MRIVILGAFLDEIEDIKKIFRDLREIVIAKRRCWVTQYNHYEITISLTGIGTTAAASTTTALCSSIDPDLIIVCGVAGALDSSLMIGDLVLANEIIDADLYGITSSCKGTPYEKNCLTDPHTSKQISITYQVVDLIQEIVTSLTIDRLRIGKIITSNIFPAPPNLFAENNHVGCSAIEMESVGVFKAAEHFTIPVMTIRAISNLFNEDGVDQGTETDSLQICSKRLAMFFQSLLGQDTKLVELARIKNENNINDIIKKHNLSQHPEGGWYRQTFKSKDMVKAQGSTLGRYAGEVRAAGTSIIYLLSQGDYSAWHLVQSDETWNFHDGDDVLLRIIDQTSGDLKEVALGLSSGLLQYTIKAGDIFSAETIRSYSLVGCMVTPGFEYNDFKLITMSEFNAKYPQYSMFARLIRDKPVVNMHKDEHRVTLFKK